MKQLLLSFFLLAFIACKEESKQLSSVQTVQDTTKVADFREFKVLDSKYIESDSIWAPFNKDLEAFSEERYTQLLPLILDQDIPTLQKAVYSGNFTYEELTLFYLKRIQKYDRNNDLSLNSVISLNPNVLQEARVKDQGLKNKMMKHPVFGIPVLLKDNINTADMPTTAGAIALANNNTEDAFIVKRLKENGALILGKANLSEWAYFFCGDCPSGYSAVGGQTLNPYGRRTLDTGGSSSGSAVSVAANFAPVAVGSETSGSILSPASQNSLVGLKPTIGVLSRGGIVPISSYLDTPGPITKNVRDNAILFSAMSGRDSQDPASVANKNNTSNYYESLAEVSLKGKRFGAIKSLMEDSLYVAAINDLKSAGAEIIEFEGEDLDLPNFTRFLNIEMKRDLPVYFKRYGNKDLPFKSVKDVVSYNNTDSLMRSPYGQKLFDGIVADSATTEEFAAIKDTLITKGKQFFEGPMRAHNLDGILSINNYHAGYAAVAKYPAITVPMGYAKNNAPKGLTFIARPYQEAALLSWALAYEKASKKRVSPENYKN
ncbi:amidase [Gillisia sp. Hel_I_86]|uniref:amidase family protein n=1 Tax=Gillisia sp. Hel_I_86 TaxID=1249981 RepID=UPI001199CB3B|nr:amidase family protein [Gillisia sp. Hel_I_86]TVZ25414.1 amidase [Gillisia sp. Hel_I_86]